MAVGVEHADADVGLALEGEQGAARVVLAHGLAPGERRGEDAAGVDHGALLVAQELILVGVEEEDAGGGEEDQQHVEGEQPDLDPCERPPEAHPSSCASRRASSRATR